ncbi:hypothetical protein A0H81_04498 [Grifola frondosa]|uniref:Uncharacterized protein n=1 Tax=Grifola frondosa TaxID=5627 RepID=A0A1C7MFL7_GRIFR|nr:hypothetical protein A0H81_04498 [Grifola frondosa]
MTRSERQPLIAPGDPRLHSIVDVERRPFTDDNDCTSSPDEASTTTVFAFRNLSLTQTVFAIILCAILLIVLWAMFASLQVLTIVLGHLILRLTIPNTLESAYKRASLLSTAIAGALGVSLITVVVITASALYITAGRLKARDSRNVFADGTTLARELSFKPSLSYSVLRNAAALSVAPVGAMLYSGSPSLGLRKRQSRARWAAWFILCCGLYGVDL